MCMSASDEWYTRTGYRETRVSRLTFGHSNIGISCRVSSNGLACGTDIDGIPPERISGSTKWVVRYAIASLVAWSGTGGHSAT
ncbi:hypothetical protein J6590_080412 [Homalodisca vitripennis]|nr:hypothetical protein J6590_080412 [Homalodisca vitripennis]